MGLLFKIQLFEGGSITLVSSHRDLYRFSLQNFSSPSQVSMQKVLKEYYGRPSRQSQASPPPPSGSVKCIIRNLFSEVVIGSRQEHHCFLRTGSILCISLYELWLEMTYMPSRKSSSLFLSRHPLPVLSALNEASCPAPLLTQFQRAFLTAAEVLYYESFAPL